MQGFNHFKRNLYETKNFFENLMSTDSVYEWLELPPDKMARHKPDDSSAIHPREKNIPPCPEIGAAKCKGKNTIHMEIFHGE